MATRQSYALIQLELKAMYILVSSISTAIVVAAVVRHVSSKLKCLVCRRIMRVLTLCGMSSLQLVLWCCGMRSIKETFGKRDWTGITSVPNSGHGKLLWGRKLSRHLRITSCSSCNSTIAGVMAMKRKAVEGAQAAWRKKSRIGMFLLLNDVVGDSHIDSQQMQTKMYSWVGNRTIQATISRLIILKRAP
jgi:hypothetical protein